MRHQKCFYIILYIIFSTTIYTQNSFWKDTGGPKVINVYDITSDSLQTTALVLNSRSLYFMNDDGSWRLINENFTQQQIDCILFYNRNTIFVGTYGSGVYRSTDAGQSWAQMNNGIGQTSIAQMYKDKNGNIYTLGFGNIQKSTNLGKNWTQCKISGYYVYTFTGFIECPNGDLLVSGTGTEASSGALIKSTDSGASWITLQSDSRNYNSIALTKDGNIFLCKDSLLFISKDNANSWESFSSPVSNPNKILSNERGDLFITYGLNGILRSTDSGKTWKDLSKSYAKYIDYFDANFNVLQFNINPKGDIFLLGYNRGVYRSTDNGDTWKRNNTGLPQLSIRVDNIISTSKDICASGTGGEWGYGVFSALKNDGTDGWVQLENQGATFYSCMAKDKNDNIYASYRGAFIVKTSLTGYTAIGGGHFSTSNVTDFIIGPDKEIVATTLGDGVYKTIDSLSGWMKVNNNLKDLYVNSIATDISGNIIIGTQKSGIFKSTDNCKTWDQQNNGIPDLNIISLGITPKGIIYAGTQNGYILKSANGGNSWSSVYHISSPIKKIILNSQGILFALTTSCIYSSPDEGLTWTPVESIGVNSQLTTICLDTLDFLYAGTYDKGVFKSTETTRIGLPDKPSLISITNGSQTPVSNILLSWGEVKFSNMYFLQVANDSLFNNIVISDSITGKTSKTINLPPIKAKYYWRVIARNIIGVSPWSETWAFMSIPTPSVPVLCLPENNSNKQPVDVILSWNKSLDADKYKLQVSAQINFSNLFINDSTITDTTKSVKGLKEGTKYYWNVSAKNLSGNSIFTESWNFTTSLPMPDSLTATVVSKGKLKLNWKDRSNNEEGFIIERKQAGDFQKLDSVKTNINTFIDSTVATNSTYVYRVKAYTKDAESEYTNEASATVTDVEKNYILPAEYSLEQNYPNPFNPSTLISYALPVESTVKISVFNSLGGIVKEFGNSVQSAGLHSVSFIANKLSSGVYFYSIEAKSIDGSKQFYKIRKMLLLK